jgi:hypothetical protein
MAKSDEPSPWPVITFLGLLVGVALGFAFAAYRKQNGALPSVDDLALPLEPLPQLSPSLGDIMGPSKTSAMRTITISTTTPTMLLRAIDGDWKVSVRVVSPVGSFAQFSIGQGSTDAVTVPAGTSQDIWIPRGQYLYATGNVANVVVSVSGSVDR